MCDWTGCGHTESLNVVCFHKIFIVCFFRFWPNLGGFWLVTEQTGLLAIFPVKCIWAGASQVTLVVKNPPSSVGDLRDSGLIPGSGRSSGGGQLTLIFLPGESMDREAWWAAVHGVIHQTWLKRLSTHVYLQLNYDSRLWHMGRSKMGVERGWFGKGSGFWKLYRVVLFTPLFLLLVLWLHTGGGKTTLTAFARSRCPH